LSKGSAARPMVSWSCCPRAAPSRWQRSVGTQAFVAC
jgi:hypothetical protein